MSEINRRDFIKGATLIIGGVITAVIGIPTVAYLIDPALREDAKEGWIPVAKLENIPVGTPTPFSFTLVQVNGWERTSTSHGGYILRNSEDPNDMLKFGQQGEVLAGPPPRPLDRYEEYRVKEDGTIEVYYQA
jgi:Rieske Fe-S protein